MNNSELASDYRKRGYYTNSTADEIQKDICNLQSEIDTADKRTYNGKMTRTFNNAKIAIAKLMLESMQEGISITSISSETIDETAQNAFRDTVSQVKGLFDNKNKKVAEGKEKLTEFNRKAHYRTGKDGQKYKVKSTTVHK